MTNAIPAQRWCTNIRIRHVKLCWILLPAEQMH